jgi:hypothetical protein
MTTDIDLTPTERLIILALRIKPQQSLLSPAEHKDEDLEASCPGRPDPSHGGSRHSRD